jgi:hypothetical protein
MKTLLQIVLTLTLVDTIYGQTGLATNNPAPRLGEEIEIILEIEDKEESIGSWKF